MDGNGSIDRFGGVCALIGFAIFLSFLLIDEMLLGGWLLEDIFMNNTDRRESLIAAIIFGAFVSLFVLTLGGLFL